MKSFDGYRRGINLGGWLSQCAEYSENHYNSFIAENDIEKIAAWGLDHVRLPVDYKVIEDEDGNPSESGCKHIDDCIEWCEKQSLKIIIDLHKTKGYSFDEADKNSLFGSEELQKRFISIWKRLAERYGKYKNVSFELLNEIAVADSEQWSKLASEAIGEIRKYAPAVKIIIGGTQWNSVHTLADLKIPDDENIVYNFHFYEPFLFTHQLASWLPIISDKSIGYPADIEEYRRLSEEIKCFGSGLKNADKMGAEFMEKLISEAVTAAENANVPLYCGEYGVIDRADIEDTAEWYRDINSVFEKYGIGRAAWTYKEMDFGIIGQHYSSAFESILKSL